MKIIRLVGLALLLAVAVGAQVRRPSQKKPLSQAALIRDGNAIYDLCRHYKTDGIKTELGFGCLMYIGGVTQTLLLNDDTETMTSPCPGKGVKEEQITDVVIKWLEGTPISDTGTPRSEPSSDNPAKRDMPGPYVVNPLLICGQPRLFRTSYSNFPDDLQTDSRWIGMFGFSK